MKYELCKLGSVVNEKRNVNTVSVREVGLFDLVEINVDLTSTPKVLKRLF